MKRSIMPLLALSLLAALAYFLPKLVQQTEGFAPLAETMAKDVAAEAPPVQPTLTPVEPIPQLDPIPEPIPEPTPPPAPAPAPMPAVAATPAPAPVVAAPVAPAAPDLTPFVEAMASGDHAKAAALIDLMKASLPAEKYKSLSASVAAAREREQAMVTEREAVAAKALAEAKAAAEEAKAAAALAAAKPAPAPAMSSDPAVIESLKQLQQAQQQTAKMLAAISTQQEKVAAMPVRAAPAPAPVSAQPAAPSSDLPKINVPTSNDPLPGTTVILFGRDSSVLDPAQATKLAPLLGALQKDKALRVELRGFADKSGSTDYNLGLSRARATAVQDIFRRANIENARISLLPMGSFQAGELAADKAAEMRKVEVLVVK